MHLECIGGIINAYKIYVRQSECRDHYEKLSMVCFVVRIQ